MVKASLRQPTSRRQRRVWTALAMAGLLAACGQEAQVPIVFGTVEPSPPASSGPTTVSSVAASSTSTSIVAASPAGAAGWTDATGTLFDVDSLCHQVFLVAAHPALDLVLAGVPHTGLWGVADGSDRWEQLDGGAGSAAITNMPQNALFDPADPQRFWIAGIYGPGVYRTDDGGSTWVELPGPANLDAVSVDFTDPDRATIIGTHHEAPLVSGSADGGETWTDISGDLPAGAGYSFSPLVLDASTYLLGTQMGSASGIYRTEDGGAHWIRLTERAVAGQPAVLEGGSIVWPVDDGSLVRSDDGGATWATVSGPSTVGPQLLVTPSGAWATVRSSVLVSQDEGQSWQVVGEPIPFERTAGFTYSPGLASFFAWRFACPTGDEGLPPEPNQVIRLQLTEPL